MAPRTKKSCFFIAPIGSRGSVERNRSDLVLKAFNTTGCGRKYQIVRGDQISKPGSITDQIIQQVFNSDLAIVDLTGLNPNVVYELGVRHTFNLPTVQIMDEGQKIPFDLYGERTIIFKYDDAESIDRAVSELRRFVRETERITFKSTSPVSRSIEIADLHRQSTAISDALASVLEEVISMKSTVEDIDKQTWSIESTVDSIVSTVAGLDGTAGPDLRDKRLFENLELLLQRIDRKMAG